MSVADKYTSTTMTAYQDRTYGYFVSFPFANCQMFAVGNLDRLLGGEYKSSTVVECFENCMLMAGGRKQVTIDVYQSYLPLLKKCFSKDKFMIEAPYTNGTGNSMVICMIKIR